MEHFSEGFFSTTDFTQCLYSFNYIHLSAFKRTILSTAVYMAIHSNKTAACGSLRNMFLHVCRCLGSNNGCNVWQGIVNIYNKWLLCVLCWRRRRYSGVENGASVSTFYRPDIGIS